MARRKLRKTASASDAAAKPVREADGRRSAIRRYADVAESDEDLFERAEDKILLDGERRDARARGRADDDAFMSDEEVMRIEAPDSDDEAEDVEDVDEDEDLDPDELDARASREKGDDLDNWGDSKREYYDADELDEDADLKAEEEEARRIQRQNLAKLDASAFVDDLGAWKDGAAESDDEDAEGQGAEADRLMGLSDEAIKSMSHEDRLQLLHARHPEFDPLAGEYTRLSPVLAELQALLTARPIHPQAKLIELKISALRGYLAVMAFYFHYLTQQDALRQQPVREHEMTITMVQCREAWNRVADFVIDEDLSDDESSTAAPVAPSAQTAAVESVVAQAKSKKRKRSSAARAPAADAVVPDAVMRKTVSFAPLTIGDGLDSEDDIDAAVRGYASVRDRRLDTTGSGRLSDRADAVADAVDAEDAAQRRKSLRFHASRIASKAGKRLRHQTQSGDADVPYRERRKEREARLQREADAAADKAQLGAGGDDLDDFDTAPRANNDSGSTGKDGDDAEYDDNDYYSAVATASKASKLQRKAEHDASVAAVRAARAGYAMASIDGAATADGKRAIDRTIAANKGLTPRRAKENRNARVKKRKRFEAAQKKVGSQKAVFKEGMHGRAYRGETTGINGRVVKSVRLDQGDARRR